MHFSSNTILHIHFKIIDKDKLILYNITRYKGGDYMSNTLFSSTVTAALCGPYTTTGSFLNDDGQNTLLTTYLSATTSISSNFNLDDHINITISSAEEYVESLSDEELAKLAELADNKIATLSKDNTVAKVKTLK